MFDRRPNSSRSNGIRTLTEAQARPVIWTPPTGPLGELTSLAEERARAAEGSLTQLEAAARTAAAVPSLRAALRRAHVAVIAELKRQSPSKGVLNAGLDVSVRAAEYQAGGAAALSVLTEPTRFGGALDDLGLVGASSSLPRLRKDFIVDRIQLLEARVAGASAVLLIARALAPGRMATLAAEAHALGLDVLLEVRDEEQLADALAIPDGIIGVNNRDLETLVIDDTVSARLLPLIPVDRIAVYESGVEDRGGVERAAALGADAVLVGSSLSVAQDGRAAVAALADVPVRRRG
jgi:indole-3-glycerol phosphate synthase